MLQKIIHFSVRNKLIVLLLALGLAGWGAYSVTQLPIDAVPDITNNQVLIITSSPSLGAPDVERFITVPIEQSTRNIPGIIEQRSFSRFGLSLVTVVFSDRTDIYWARQQVSERLAQARAAIPAGMGDPQLGPVTTGLGEIYQYVVKPKPGYEGKYDLLALRDIQDWVVRRQLLGTEGVADVSSFGGMVRQYEVSVDPAKLKSFHLTITDVFKSLQANNQNTGGAYIERGPNVLFIRSEGLAGSIEDIGQIVVRQAEGGIPVLMRDVAVVRIGHAIRYGAMSYNDQGEVSGAVVMMLKGENSHKVISAIKQKIEEIRKTLPEGVEIEAFLDRTKMVDHAIGTVERNLAEGALIVLLVLVIFMGNIRAGLIVASVIPLSMLFAVILMNAFGVSGNLMSLGALDFGLLVDGAVIITEAVMHKLTRGAVLLGVSEISRERLDEEVERSAGNMMQSAAFGQIIILIVYLPILSLQGIEGKMFRPMAETVSFAILGAFLLSLTYVPMMGALLLSRKLRHRESFADRMMKRIQAIYRPLLTAALRVPGRVVLGAFLLFGLSVMLLTTLGGEFIPQLEEGDFAVDTRLLTGASLPTTVRTTQQAAGLLLRKFPEVEKIVTKTGSAEIPTDPMSLEASDMMVILKPKEQWVSARGFPELAGKMSKALEEVPGITTGFEFPVQMRFNELMTGARQDVVCKIFGDDLDTLALYADRLGRIVRTVNGARDLYIETVTGVPQMVIHYDRAALARFGVSISDINAAVQASYAGAVAGFIFEEDRRYDLVVRMDDRGREDVGGMANLPVGLPNGEQVPLNLLASIRMQDGPYQVQREDARRRITVGFNVRGRDIQSIVRELQDKIGAQVSLPSGYYITYGGQYENLQNATRRLSIALPVALLLIFLLLFFAFRNLRYGAMIFSAIPLSAIGGVCALWLRGMPFSISAGVGFIALFGVAVLNGIVLIGEMNQLRKEGMTDIKAMLFRATEDRLRPVLMTATVASLGFLPMALSQGAGAEVQRPLATVVIGGLVTATLLTLLVLPCLYWLVEKGWKNGGDGGRRRKGTGPGENKKGAVMTGILLLAMGLGAISGKGQVQARPMAAGETRAEMGRQRGKETKGGVGTSGNGDLRDLPAGMPEVPGSGKLGLEEALALARRQNSEIGLSRLQEAYYSELRQASIDPPKTQLSLEGGNINSAAFDSRFTVSQGFAFPALYKRQRTVFEQEWISARQQITLKEAEIIRLVREAYLQMQVIHARQAMLEQADSIFGQFTRMARLRYEKGESNLLEKVTLENQAQQVNMQLAMSRADQQTASVQLAALLHERGPLDVRDSLEAGEIAVDSGSLEKHPYLESYRQQERIAVSVTRMEKAKLLPDWTIGYTNQSIVGWQMSRDQSDHYYGGGSRFSTGQLGIGLPIFNKAQKAKIRAAAKWEEAAALGTEAAADRLRAQWARNLGEYGKYLEVVRYYQASALPQSELMIRTAGLQYRNGEISYIEWGTLVGNALGLRSQYIDVLRELGLRRIALEYLQGL